MNTNTKVKSSKAAKLGIDSASNTLIYLAPALFALLIIPLVVHMNIIPLDAVTFPYWTGQDANVDFFSYAKAFLIKISAIASIIAFIAASFRNKLTLKHLNKVYALMSIYAALAIASTIFSRYKATSLNGFADRYEGLYVILSYLILMFLAITFVNRESHARIMLGLLFVSAVIIGTIGIFQFVGYDLLSTNFARQFTIPAKYQYLSQFITSKFTKYTICSTLYNTNYVGSYMAMLFPITLTLTILIKKGIYKIGMGLLSCLMLINLVGCRSRAGLAGGAVAVLLMLILVRRKLIPNLKIIIPVIFAFAAIFIVLNNQSGGAIIKRLAPEEIFPNKFISQAPGPVKAELKDIILDGFKASIITTKNTINMELINNQLKFTDKNGQYLIMNKDKSGKITFDDKLYSDYTFNLNQKSIIAVTFQDMNFQLYVGEHSIGIVGERGIIFMDMVRPEKYLFEGMERYATSRGYIWSRKLPMLKDTLLIGSGPDTYVFMFPQHDFVGKLKAFGKTNEIVDKPHNMYLQIAVNTGVVSMVAVIALFILYSISCIRLYTKGIFNTGAEVIGTAIYTGFTGYVIAGLINDSLVSVAPVFWVLFGMGIAINYMVEAANNKIKAEKAEGAQA